MSFSQNSSIGHSHVNTQRYFFGITTLGLDHINGIAINMMVDTGAMGEATIANLQSVELQPASACIFAYALNPSSRYWENFKQPLNLHPTLLSPSLT